MMGKYSIKSIIEPLKLNNDNFVLPKEVLHLLAELIEKANSIEEPKESFKFEISVGKVQFEDKITRVKEIFEEADEEGIGVFWECEDRFELSIHILSGDPDVVFFKETKEVMIDFTTDSVAYEESDGQVLLEHFNIIQRIKNILKE